MRNPKLRPIKEVIERLENYEHNLKTADGKFKDAEHIIRRAVSELRWVLGE